MKGNTDGEVATKRVSANPSESVKEIVDVSTSSARANRGGVESEVRQSNGSWGAHCYR